MNAPLAQRAQLIKKITASVITGGQVNPDMPSPIKEARDLFDLFGIAVKTRAGHTDKGDWLQFIGQFEAVTPDGEIYSSPRCHIPQPFEDMLFSQLQMAQERDPKATVTFAVRVSVVPPTKGKPSAVGYEYRVTPLIDSEAESNPLTLLRQQVAKAGMPALKGPSAGAVIAGAHAQRGR
jgi:hypothetical protein